jgi:hypothetical protein
MTLQSHYPLLPYWPFGVGLVMRGASERLSPILMTALATALALLPLGVQCPGVPVRISAARQAGTEPDPRAW